MTISRISHFAARLRAVPSTGSYTGTIRVSCKVRGRGTERVSLQVPERVGTTSKGTLISSSSLRGLDRGLGLIPLRIWLVGNGGVGYNYNYHYYHSSIPYKPKVGLGLTEVP